MSDPLPRMPATDRHLDRRTFLASLASIAGVAGLVPLKALGAAEPVAPPTAPGGPRIRLGLVGCGQRGAWISRQFLAHGGFTIAAVADYFPAVARTVGTSLGVPAERCFSGLHGYRRLIDSGIDALVIEDVPHFFPEQATAAVAAGCHVFLAKPVAVDVPGCLAIAAAGHEATRRQKVFLVDYQMSTDPVNQEVAATVRAGGLGPLAQIVTVGANAGHADRPLTASIADRLRDLVWTNDTALGGGFIGNFGIHTIDAAVWAVGRRPVAAMGAAARLRPDAHGDAHDVHSVVYTFDDGLSWLHRNSALKGSEGCLTCTCHGRDALALLTYWGKAYVRGGPRHCGAREVMSLYDRGVQRNIADFHRCITTGDCRNPTVERAVDGTLTAILGREAAERGRRLTMEELLTENRRLTVDLKGLDA